MEFGRAGFNVASLIYALILNGLALTLKPSIGKAYRGLVIGDGGQRRP